MNIRKILSTTLASVMTFSMLAVGGTTAFAAAPASDFFSEVVVTGMPDISIYGSSRTEYFQPFAGFTAGDFNSNYNEGNSRLEQVETFYKHVFDTDSADLSKYAYSLFGSKTITSDPKFNGTYHLGVDVNYARGRTIKCAQSGQVIRANKGGICIYDAVNECTYVYMHLNIDSALLNTEPEDDVFVDTNTVLGTQGSVGTVETHLHFEVINGYSTNIPFPTDSLTEPLTSLIPYDYMSYYLL